MIIQYQWIRVHNTFNNRLTEAIDEGPGASDPSGKTPDQWGREPSKKCLRGAIVEVRNSSGKSKVLNNRKRKPRKQNRSFQSVKNNRTSSAVTQFEGKWFAKLPSSAFANITQWFKMWFVFQVSEVSGFPCSSLQHPVFLKNIGMQNTISLPALVHFLWKFTWSQMGASETLKNMPFVRFCPGYPCHSPLRAWLQLPCRKSMAPGIAWQGKPCKLNTRASNPANA